jgi:hypothetical protein
MNSDNNLSESQANSTIPSNSKSEYYKKWYAENKANKLAYQKEKIKCDICNSMIARGNMTDHCKSATHINNQNLNKKNELYNKINKLEGELNTTIKEIKELLNTESI